MRHAPPPQHSSTVTTLRILVMLTCLVGIPTIALQGTAVPGMIREYLIQKLGGSIRPPDRLAGLDEAPRFVPPSAASLEPAAGFASPPTSLSPSAYAPPEFTGQPPRDEPPAGFQDPLQAPPPWGTVNSPAPIRESQPGYSGQGSVAIGANVNAPSGWPNTDAVPAPSGYPAIDATNQGIPLASGQGPNVGAQELVQTASPSGTVDEFLYIQQRLRDLGADYYLLENWGNQGECYRFHCRVAVANSANFTKHFEATAEQPLRAMTQVLADVESWRRGSAAWEPLPNPPATVGQTPRDVPLPASSPHGPYIR